MKGFVVYIISMMIGMPIWAEVQIYVCDPGTLEPLNQTDVITGSTVSIVVYSDSGDWWSGGLFIDGNDRLLGELTLRGGDPNEPCGGSCLPQAGPNACVRSWRDSDMWGFDCYVSLFDRSSGPWFLLDYTALAEGNCRVGYYPHDNDDWDKRDTQMSITFSNYDGANLNDDKMVDFLDFSLFAAQWLTFEDPNDPTGADFTGDGFVGLADLRALTFNWLQKVQKYKE